MIRWGRDSRYLAEDLVVIGQLGKAHGLRGEIRCRPETDFPERFLETHEVELFSDSLAPRRIEVEGCRFHGELVLLKLKGLDTLEQVQQVRNLWVAVGPDEVFQRPGDYLHFQLEGLVAVDPSGLPLGHIQEVLANPAHPIYRIMKPNGEEMLVPAVDRYVIKVDLEGKTVTIQPPLYAED